MKERYTPPEEKNSGQKIQYLNHKEKRLNR